MTITDVLIVFNVVLLAVLMVMAVIYYCSRWACERAVTIPFRTFLAMYEIAPEKWDIETDHPMYRASEFNNYYTNLPVIDWLRFLSWRRKKEKQERKLATVKSYQKLVDRWQEDIERYKEAAQNEVNQMAEKNLARTVHWEAKPETKNSRVIKAKRYVIMPNGEVVEEADYKMRV